MEGSYSVKNQVTPTSTCWLSWKTTTSFTRFFIAFNDARTRITYHISTFSFTTMGVTEYHSVFILPFLSSQRYTPHEHSIVG